MPVVILGAERYFSSEKGCFDSGIEIAVLFPCDGLVLKFGGECSSLASVCPSVVVKALSCVVTSDVIVALYTIGSFYGQIVEPGRRKFHELFL